MGPWHYLIQWSSEVSWWKSIVWLFSSSTLTPEWDNGVLWCLSWYWTTEGYTLLSQDKVSMIPSYPQGLPWLKIIMVYAAVTPARNLNRSVTQRIKLNNYIKVIILRGYACHSVILPYLVFFLCVLTCFSEKLVIYDEDTPTPCLEHWPPPPPKKKKKKKNVKKKPVSEFPPPPPTHPPRAATFSGMARAWHHGLHAMLKHQRWK